MDIEEVITFSLSTIFGIILFVFGYPIFIGIFAGHGARWVAEEQLYFGKGAAIVFGWMVGLASAYAAVEIGLHYGLFFQYGDGDGCTGAKYQC